MLIFNPDDRKLAEKLAREMCIHEGHNPDDDIGYGAPQMIGYCHRMYLIPAEGSQFRKKAWEAYGRNAWTAIEVLRAEWLNNDAEQDGA